MAGYSFNQRKQATNKLPLVSLRKFGWETRAIVWIIRVFILTFLFDRCSFSGINYENAPNYPKEYEQSARKRYLDDPKVPRYRSPYVLHHLQLNLIWPAGKATQDPSLSLRRTREHIKKYPNHLVAHGLWGVNKDHKSIVFCSTYHLNRKNFFDFFDLLKTMKDKLKEHWPVLSEVRKYSTILFDVWVR